MSGASPWRVCFMDVPQDKARWWQRRLRRGFRHVWLTRRLWRGVSLWVEWTPEGLLAHMTPTAQARRAEAQAAAVGIFAPRAPERSEPVLHLGPWNCATIAAHALQLRVHPCTTPHGLARALAARGAVFIRGGEGV